MKVHQEIVHAATNGQGFVDVTSEIARVVKSSKVSVGMAQVFVQHTSASLVIQENADPAVLRDLQKWMARIAPEDAKAYEHDQEGDDDMPAHLRSAVTKTSEMVPVRDGSLALGTWQAIYVWEHRARPHRRSLVVTVMGE
jgi:secondary thiamine-phosphate synthase enzyme